MIPAEILQDRNHDGLVDYLNARIYVADDATAAEIAAAANIAARLAFEVLSLDFPLAFPMSAYQSTDISVAVVVGTAALQFIDTSNKGLVQTRDGSRTVLAIPHPSDAETFARTLDSSIHALDAEPESDIRRGKRFSLASVYSAEGLLGDPDGDQIPERVETTIVLGPAVHSIEVIHLAARIALESAGIQLPLVIVDCSDPPPPNAIFIGRSVSEPPDLLPGQGQIQIIHSSEEVTAIIITGADPEGESEALRHFAQRLPNVWNCGKEYLHLAHIEEDLRRFFSLRSEAGQSAAALMKARELVREIPGESLESAELEILIDGDDGPSLEYIAAQFPDLRVTASHLNVRTGPLVFDDTLDLPWEVDEVRRKILYDVIPRIQKGSAVEMDLRVSESPAVRLSLSEEIRKQVIDRGTNPEKTTIHVIAAHKQAYCWIDEIVKPRLIHASRIRIQYRETASDGFALVESPQRWLQELYPIDEVLSRDLGIPIDNITFHKADSRLNATYEVLAEDESGKIILQQSFEPRFVVQPMFQAFPDYARVRVNTGWLQSIVDESVITNDRIETDPEKFWNRYQSETLPKIRDYIRQLYDGVPTPESAPYFGLLEVDLWLSEPDYRIGIDEERISTLEALHEDIYFETLLFCELLGLKNPGRIIPRVHPARDRQNGLARIRFTGKAGPNPRVVLKWEDRNGQKQQRTEDLFPVRIENPTIQSLTVKAGHSSVVAIDVSDVPLTLENLERFEAVREFHDHGVGLAWLSYENIDRLRLGSIDIPRTSECFRQPQIQALPLPSGIEPIVQWETPIGPAECERLLQRLAAFPEVHPFHAGKSYLGRNIWALDVMAPCEGRYISQARSSVTKPVVFITGRQHANEVSSTSHILKLAELLATDPEIRKLLDHVHFILQPMTNPDGAALVEELFRDTPDFMLHAGYLGSLGSDVTEEQWSLDPLYPESRVRRELWKMWLPDVVLNPHGYPSHEWVQMFAGYTAWVKTRSATARDWWIPRGWFVPGFAFMESTREPALRLRDCVMEALGPHLGPWNHAMYRRYTKYGADSNFKTEFCKDLMVYSLRKGLDFNAGGFTFMQRYPQVTLVETVTEVPDEVAHGPWLKTIAQAGLEFSLAVARYIAENHNEVKRSVRLGKGTELRIVRKRP